MSKSGHCVVGGINPGRLIGCPFMDHIPQTEKRQHLQGCVWCAAPREMTVAKKICNETRASTFLIGTLCCPMFQGSIPWTFIRPVINKFQC